jgi:hypothetical protein
MDRGSRSITEWRLRLEPILVESIRKLHENAVVHMRSFTERPRRANLNPNRTEEHPKMAEQPDDLGIPMKARPASATTVPPRVADLLRPGAVPARAPGPPQQPTEQPVGSHGHEVDRQNADYRRGNFPVW